MAVKTADFEYHWYIPKLERESDDPFAICAAPLNKGEYDTYMRAIRTQFERGGQVTMDRSKAIKDIYRRRVREIRNVIISGKLEESVTDTEQIIWVMTHLGNNVIADDIEDFILGQSVLMEDEESNFISQLGLGRSSMTETGKTSPSGHITPKPPVENVKPQADKMPKEGDSAWPPQDMQDG